MNEPTREVLHDANGTAVLSYDRAEFNHAPWADRAEPLAPHAAVEAMARLRGWRVSCSEEFGAELTAAGADLDRHARTMMRDLRTDPPPADWARAAAPDGVRIEPGIAVPLEQIWAVNAAAFGPDHPDLRHNRAEPEKRRELFGELLAGKLLGPVAPGSACAFASDDELVGAIAIFRFVEADEPLPWIGTVFRAPGERWRGLGEALIRRATAAQSAAGLRRMGLAVTVGNPAQALYERMGFAVVETKLSVRIPA